MGTSCEMPKVKLVPEMYALEIETVKQSLSNDLELHFVDKRFAPIHATFQKLNIDLGTIVVAGDYLITTCIGRTIITKEQYNVLAKI